MPEVDGNCLLVNSVPIDRLAKRIGRTPFYAYDRSAIVRRVAELRSAMPPGLRIFYAIKANPMPAVVQCMSSITDGLDVASAGELRTALDTGIAPEHIHFAGPGKSDAELAQAVAAGIVINVESERELDVMASAGTDMGVRPRFALRVNPDFALASSGMRMGGGPKQFGIDVEQAPSVLARTRKCNVEFVGLHIFCGSQILDAETIATGFEKSVDLALSLAEYAPTRMQMVTIGGGFGIPYFPADKPLDLGPIARRLAALEKRVNDAHHGAHLAIELGRYLVGESGVYVCRVIDRKVSRGEVFLVTDGGMHHHLAASGNFGQVIRKNFPVVIANRMGDSEREIANVVGPLCTPLDLLASKLDLAKAYPGDLVAVLQSGAYGLSASPTAFLGHPPPVEVLV